ncbi:MAG TPA: antitoxin Xre/MbcA/ParS toxin-binding domain-containing protein [Sphingomicrobium sp.]|nr:antitoxin Xre/MbcA/ParS toxin-binding domain-containing protein [Sphingomicrobium sp.]
MDSVSHADPMQRVRAIERGLPVKVLRDLLKIGITMAELSTFVAPRRTLERRMKNGGRLTVEESDRVDRFLHVLDFTSDTFEDRDDAIDWLRSPVPFFDDQPPLELLKTGAGADAVENFLGLARHGMLA